MGLFEHFPWTNMQDLNLSWFLNAWKRFEAEFKNLEDTVTPVTAQVQQNKENIARNDKALDRHEGLIAKNAQGVLNNSINIQSNSDLIDGNITDITDALRRIGILEKSGKDSLFVGIFGTVTYEELKAEAEKDKLLVIFDPNPPQPQTSDTLGSFYFPAFSLEPKDPYIFSSAMLNITTRAYLSTIWFGPDLPKGSRLYMPLANSNDLLKLKPRDFPVIVSKQGSTYTANKTYRDVQQAFKDGRTVFMLYDNARYDYEGDTGGGNPHYRFSYVDVSTGTTEKSTFTYRLSGAQGVLELAVAPSNSELVLIEEFTSGDIAAPLKKDKEPNGSPYNFTTLLIQCIFPNSTYTSADRIKNISARGPGGAVLGSSFIETPPDGKETVLSFKTFVDHGYWNSVTFGKFDSVYGLSSPSYAGTSRFPVRNVKQEPSIGQFVMDAVPHNTKIKIWAIRKEQ